MVIRPCTYMDSIDLQESDRLGEVESFELLCTRGRRHRNLASAHSYGPPHVDRPHRPRSASFSSTSRRSTATFCPAHSPTFAHVSPHNMARKVLVIVVRCARGHALCKCHACVRL